MKDALSMVDLRAYQRLVGIPFKWGGRDLQGMDCWGIVLAGLRVRGVVAKDTWETVKDAFRGGWRPEGDDLPSGFVQVAADAPYEAGQVLRLPGGEYVHLGLYVGGGWVLEGTKEQGSVMTPLRKLQPLVVERWRWEGSRGGQRFAQPPAAPQTNHRQC